MARLIIQLCLEYMPDIYIQFCRSAVAGKTNSKAKTGTAALGSVRDWCHNYDLTKPTSLQDLSQSKAVRQAAPVSSHTLDLFQLCLLCNNAYREVGTSADDAYFCVCGNALTSYFQLKRCYTKPQEMLTILCLV